MKEKIETLIAENKLLKDQCWATINELRESRFNRSLKTGTKIAKLETEYENRKEFIEQLESLKNCNYTELSAFTEWNSKEDALNFDEKQDKF